MTSHKNQCGGAFLRLLDDGILAPSPADMAILTAEITQAGTKTEENLRDTLPAPTAQSAIPYSRPLLPTSVGPKVKAAAVQYTLQETAKTGTCRALAYQLGTASSFEGEGGGGGEREVEI